MSAETGLWITFAVVVVLVLTLDLGVFNRRAHAVKFKEALIWCSVWIGIACLFGLAVYLLLGSEKGIAFFTGYVIEESLSVDNLFVFLMLFTYFCVPQTYRHKVLFYGIIGAVIMRAIFILAGVALFEAVHWIIYVFGAFLILTGVRMGIKKEEEVHPENNPIFKFFCRHFPVTSDYRNGFFTVVEKGRRYFTPLFLVVLTLETTDVIFAIDSIPAVLAVTQDPFIVFTSNMFAVMGLRALYFVLAGFVERLYYLHYGLAVILVFLGFKMLLSDVFEVPTLASLGFIALVLIVSVLASVYRPHDIKLTNSESCKTDFEHGNDKPD
jgi:tellurite resistance protein TerC